MSYRLMKYPYAKTIHMISTEWSLSFTCSCYTMCWLLHLTVYVVWCLVIFKIISKSNLTFSDTNAIVISTNNNLNHFEWMSMYIRDKLLKLPSLFTAWRFWTVHPKSHNLKTLVILRYSWSPFLPLTCLLGQKWPFVGLCVAFWSIFLRENSSQITYANHMTMTTSGQI